MKLKFATLCLIAGTAIFARADDIGTVLLSNRNARISVSNGLGTISFSNTFFNGVCTVEGQAGQRWVVLDNFFATQRVGQVTMPLQTNGYRRFRLKSLDISPGNAFTRLAQSYGNIQTIAGKSQVPPGINAWQPEYEGADATNVNLSNPRSAMADEAGNIYVVEQDGHALLKITPDGRIQTVMGTHQPGNFHDSAVATQWQLDSPSAIWVTGGSVYILDRGNTNSGSKRICKVTAGVAQELVFDAVGADPGGGLWVAPDESEFLYAAGTELIRRNSKAERSVLASGFREVGNVLVNASDRTIVCDPLDNRVYRIRGHEKLVIAGDGFKRNRTTGGDADRVSLPGARSIWYLPIGGYFIGLDEGARIWYVDADDNAAPFVFGKPGIHTGDGKWFRAPGPKIGNVKSVTMTPHGDILIVEGSFIRKIDFKRHLP